MVEIFTDNKRKNYITPHVEFEEIEAESLLAAESPDLGTGSGTDTCVGDNCDKEEI